GRRITLSKLYDLLFRRYGVKFVFPYTMNGTGVSENFSKCQNQFFLFCSVKGCQEHVSCHYESRVRVRVRVRVSDENYRSDPLRSLPKSLTPEQKVVEL